MSSAGALLLASGAGADRIHHTLCAFAEVLRVDLFRSRRSVPCVNRPRCLLVVFLVRRVEIFELATCRLREPDQHDHNEQRWSDCDDRHCLTESA